MADNMNKSNDGSEELIATPAFTHQDREHFLEERAEEAPMRRTPEPLFPEKKR